MGRKFLLSVKAIYAWVKRQEDKIFAWPPLRLLTKYRPHFMPPTVFVFSVVGCVLTFAKSVLYAPVAIGLASIIGRLWGWHLTFHQAYWLCVASGFVSWGGIPTVVCYSIHRRKLRRGEYQSAQAKVEMVQS